MLYLVFFVGAVLLAIGDQCFGFESRWYMSVIMVVVITAIGPTLVNALSPPQEGEDKAANSNHPP